MAAAGLGLPLAIHFLTRPRGVRFALPTFVFLAESVNRSSRWHGLRSILVLLFRALALAALALGFARFAERGAGPVADGEHALKRRIVVLDCSMSMRALDGGAPLFERAQAMAQKQLSDSRTSQADLILAARTARAVFGRTSANLVALREEAAQAHALPETFEATTAMDTAARSLSRISPEDLADCEVTVISDLQRSNWSKVHFGAIPKGVGIRLLAVRSGPDLANICITKAFIAGMPEAGAEMYAAADVTNFGPAQVSTELTLNFDGRNWSKKLDLAPGVIEHVVFELTNVPAGWRYGHFTLPRGNAAEDALADDNVYPVCAQVRDGRHVTLITLESKLDTGGPAYFLERALSASPDSSVSVARLSPALLEGELDASLWRSDLLAVVNCGSLTEPQAASLSRVVSSGISAIFVTQYGADAENLKLLQTQLGGALRLPAEFRMLPNSQVTSSALSGVLNTQGHRRRTEGGRFLVSVNSQRRPFKIFGDSVTRFTRGLMLSGGLASSSGDSAADNDNILAKYSDGSAALTIADAGSGRLAVLNMAVGGDELHLGAHALFVPMIQELCLELLDNGTEHSTHVSGTPLSVPLPRWALPAVEKDKIDKNLPELTLLREDGSKVLLPDTSANDGPVFRTEAGHVSLVWPTAGAPGVYRIESSAGTVQCINIVPPAEESNLAALEPETLTQRLAQDRAVSVANPESLALEERNKETFDWFFLAAAGMLLGELAVLKIFRS